MLSYIELINRFWEMDELRKYDPAIKSHFSGNETRLYFHLLKMANKLFWPAEFAYSDKELTAKCGINKGTLKPARMVLESAGLFDWQSGGKGQGDSVVYWIRYQNLTPKTIEECESRYQTRGQKLTPNGALVPNKVPEIDTNTYNKTEDFFENSTSGVRSQILTPKNLPAEQPPTAPRCAPPPPTPFNPVPARLDPYDPRSADLVNVRFSDWWPLYDVDVQERRCRQLWVELTDEERLKAAEHIPRYVEATKHNKRWRKNPEKYLSEKTFNDEIRIWHDKDSRTQSDTDTGSGADNPGRDIIRTEYGPPPRRRTTGSGTTR